MGQVRIAAHGKVMRVVFYALALSVALLTWPVQAAEHTATVPEAPPAHSEDVAPAADAAHGEESVGHADAAHAGDDHHGSSGGLPQLNPASYPTQAFWLLITFGAMYMLLAKGSLPVISGVIENRRQHIDSDLEAAERLRTEAEKIHAAYEENLDAAREKAALAFLEVENDMKEKSSAQAKALQERSVSQLSNAEKSIATAKVAAMEEMSALAAEIARKAAEKIIGVETDINQAKDVVKSIHESKAKAA